MKKRPVTLKHLDGRICRAPSVAEFCRRHLDLGANAKFHCSALINGKHLHYKKWFLAKNPTIILLDDKNNRYKIDCYRDFIVKYNLTTYSFRQMINGLKPYCGKFRLWYTIPKPKKKKHFYVFTSPKNKKVRGESVHKILKKINLPKGETGFYNLINGNSNLGHYKKWKFKENVLV